LSKKLRALVTGGAGFIGSELVKQLKSSDDYERVVVVDRAMKLRIPGSMYLYNYDLLEEGINDLIDKHQIDVVFGLAALIGGIKYFHDHPAEILHENNQITGNTLESIRVSKRKPLFVYISSSMVFESATVFPTPEDHIYECPLPKSAYGFSKLVGEALCEAYHQQYGIDYMIARPFNAWGCNEYPKEVGVAHVIPDLIKKMLDGQGLDPENPLQILGDGTQIRCYTHVSDIAAGIIRMADHKLNPTSGKLARLGDYRDFNISVPQSHTVRQLANIIWDRIYPEDHMYVKYLPALTYDVQKRIPDVSRAKNVLGWEAKIKLEDKIDEVIDWVKSVNG
jgi:nucleoside-diphosphate-sugar epimerase